MEKINLANWNNIFGKAEQNILFASDRYCDLHFQFEEPGLAAGSIKSVSTPGMQLTELAMFSYQPFQLLDEPKETAESVFVLDGVAESRFENLPSALRFNKHDNNLQYNREFGGEHTISCPRFHALTITYDLEYLKQLLQCDENRGMAELANCLDKKKTYLANRQAIRTAGRIAEIIGSILSCRYIGAMKYCFLESKMMELFVLQMEQAQELAGAKKQDWITAADREKLHAVKNYIESECLESFSLKDLTYRFGLNEFKLKKGYKELFQITVFGHVLYLRMEKARNLLREGAMNVSEAAFYIGYNNVSSFCTEFRKQFGHSPGRYKVNANAHN